LPTSHLNDAGAVIEAKVAVHDEAYHLTRLDFSGGSLWVSKVERAAGTLMRARILARDVSVAIAAPQGSSITNILAVRIVEIQDRRAGSGKLAPDRRQRPDNFVAHHAPFA